MGSCRVALDCPPSTLDYWLLRALAEFARCGGWESAGIASADIFLLQADSTDSTAFDTSQSLAPARSSHDIRLALRIKPPKPRRTATRPQEGLRSLQIAIGMHAYRPCPPTIVPTFEMVMEIHERIRNNVFTTVHTKGYGSRSVPKCNLLKTGCAVQRQGQGVFKKRLLMALFLLRTRPQLTLKSLGYQVHNGDVTAR